MAAGSVYCDAPTRTVGTGALTMPPVWWRRPRKIRVIVDNESWILPWAECLIELCRRDGDVASLCRNHNEVVCGDVAFYLGCIKLTPNDVLNRCRRNLIVHESDLPAGRGFAPLTWQILAGSNEIPICLLEATDEPDGGDIVLRDVMQFNGTELIAELRHAQGEATVSLCRRYLESPMPLQGRPQSGQATIYSRRRPSDSRIYPDRTIAEQFDLLRTVDNERYPAFFDYRGQRYLLKIEPTPRKNS